MIMLPQKLIQKLTNRQKEGNLRDVSSQNDLIDLSSNDYLGFASNQNIFNVALQSIVGFKKTKNGATGSRLLTGNHDLYQKTELMLAKFHHAEAALLFNSGYDANLGFFSSVPQRGDIIFYDELIHASIRDGISMSNARSFNFFHNDISNLESKLSRLLSSTCSSKRTFEIYIVTESVFSMDGDIPDLKKMADFCKKYACRLIVDEAHATGVFGTNGAGLVQEFGLENDVFARIHTFGKSIGCHGAAILGSRELKQYLINFARSFIYTTGLAPFSIATIQAAYGELQCTDDIHKLHDNISHFIDEVHANQLVPYFIESSSAIQCCVIPGNYQVSRIANDFLESGYDVRPIRYPTVPEGQERIRFCLHSFNSKAEITDILQRLATFVSIEA